MNIKVISLEGCNAAVKTIDLINKITLKHSLNIAPEFVIVKTLEEANKYRHIGGPTVHINGLDIEPDAREIEQFGIS